MKVLFFFVGLRPGIHFGPESSRNEEALSVFLLVVVGFGCVFRV